jgi:hypothetical protein
MRFGETAWLAMAQVKIRSLSAAHFISFVPESSFPSHSFPGHSFPRHSRGSDRRLPLATDSRVPSPELEPSQRGLNRLRFQAGRPGRLFHAVGKPRLGRQGQHPGIAERGRLARAWRRLKKHCKLFQLDTIMQLSSESCLA